MFERVIEKEQIKAIDGKIDRLDAKLCEVIKLLKENKNSAKTAQNSSK